MEQNLQIWIPQAQFFEALRCSLLLMLLYEIAKFVFALCMFVFFYLLLRILLHLRRCLYFVCSLLLLNLFGASSA